MSTRDRAAAVAIGADVYELVAASTTGVTLVHRVTGERRTLSHHELANIVEREQHIAPRWLDTLPTHVIQAVTTLGLDIDEVLTGVGRNGDRRAQYDLATSTQEQRVARKLVEMSHAGRAMSRSTFFNKLNKYHRDGLVGLVDGRALRQYAPLDLLDPRVISALDAVIADQAARSTGTISRIIEETTRSIRETYGPIPLPSRSTWYHLVKLLGAGKHSTGSAKTRRSLAERPDRLFNKQEQLLPGSQVQVDTNTMDVEVRTPDGSRARPRLSIMTDVYSRTIMAFTVRLEATKGVDHVMLLAQAATPRQNRPPRTEWRSALQRRNPGALLLSEAEYEAHSAAHPYIYPRSITVDRGQDYISATFRSAAQQMQCSVVLSAPHTPTSKPHVERQFETVNDMFTQHLAGYTGRSAEHRGLDIPTDQLLTLEMVRELFEDWVISVWQNRPHSGLRDRIHPTRLLTPNQKAEQAALTVAQLRFPLRLDDYVRMLESVFRKVSSVGIKYNNREYDSPDLHALRGMASAHPRHGGKWEVKVDPYNPTCVWVVGRDGELIECRERGAQERIYEPEFVEAESYRALVARSDAELTGTRFPEPTPLPEHTPDAFDIELDDDDFTPTF